ncbi:metal ABC transporter substrate-binding protein [Ignatzschineria sp. LJL83]
MKRILLMALSLCALSFSHAEPLKVVTSFSILEDLTHNIGQDKISVESIIKRGQDAHSFEPTPKDILKIQNADVVVINGLNFDYWMTKILENNKYEGIIIDTSRNVPLISITDHDHGDSDPHIWQNPQNVMIMTKNIEEGLSLALPEDSPYFQNNYESYHEKLTQIDQYAKEKLGHNDNESLMVLHNSFGYLAERYHLHFVAIADVNPLAEPSAKKMAELYNLVKTENIHAIFSENIAPSRFISTLVKDLKLQDGGILYSDALTIEPPAESYLQLFKTNVDTIAKTLKNTTKD